MASASASAKIEYTIYSFDKQTGINQEITPRWQKQDTLLDLTQAMRKAEDLIKTELYDKIEVKKKFFDKKHNKTVDLTLKIYESNKKLDLTFLLITAAFICGFFAFLLAYFIGQT